MDYKLYRPVDIDRSVVGFYIDDATTYSYIVRTFRIFSLFLSRYLFIDVSLISGYPLPERVKRSLIYRA
jgi:hypothetical protein